MSKYCHKYPGCGCVDVGTKCYETEITTGGRCGGKTEAVRKLCGAISGSIAQIRLICAPCSHCGSPAHAAEACGLRCSCGHPYAAHVGRIGCPSPWGGAKRVSIPEDIKEKLRAILKIRAGFNVAMDALAYVRETSKPIPRHRLPDGGVAMVPTTEEETIINPRSTWNDKQPTK